MNGTTESKLSRFRSGHQGTKILAIFGVQEHYPLKSIHDVAREDLLNGLKKKSKRLLEEAASKRTVTETSSIVYDFCNQVEQCLKFGLNTLYRLFQKYHGSTLELLQKMDGKCDEINKLFAIIKNLEEQENLVISDNVFLTSPPLLKPKVPNQTSFKYNGTKQRINWVHLALIEKFLLPIIRTWLHEARSWYRPEGIINNENDSVIFLALISGPCAINYTSPSLDDPSWSNLSADELIERHRFLTLSSPITHIAKKRTVPGQSKYFLSNSLRNRRRLTHRPSYRAVRSPLRTTSQQTNFNLLDAGDGLFYKPVRQTLLYAKNNVLLGEQSSTAGYLAVYNNADGVNLRWTANELLLHASSLSFVNYRSQTAQHADYESSLIPESSDIDDQVRTKQAEVKRNERTHAKLGSESPRLVLNISMDTIDNIHCHKQSIGLRIVLIDMDGIQQAIFWIPGGTKAGLPFLTAIEQGSHPNITFEPLISSNYTDETPVGREITSVNDGSSSPNPIMQFVQRYLPRSILTIKSKQEKESGIKQDKDDTIHDVSQQVKLQFDDWPCEGERAQIVYKLVRNKITPDHEEHHSELLKDDAETKTINFTNSNTFSLALDNIRCNLLVNVLHAWLLHCRNVRLIRTELADLILPNSDKPDLNKAEYEHGLTKDIWTDICSSLTSAQNTAPIASTVYNYIYNGGCDPDIRPQVFQYILGVQGWTMTDKEKSENFDSIHQVYRKKLKEWTEIEEIAEKSKEGRVERAFYRMEGQLDDEHSTSVSNPSQSQTKNAKLGKILELVQKDVVRCDRHTYLFSKEGSCSSRNLSMLKRVLITYIWDHLDHGYTQGMCDVVAPFIALFESDKDDESDIERTEILVYASFCQMVKLRLGNSYKYPESSILMNEKFAQLKFLVQVLDPELIEHIHLYEDFTDFCFCYRWFLLDFKREFPYGDIFKIWETLIAATHCISTKFELFIALAMIRCYRDVIIDTQMEFTDILRFLNERAEKHDVQLILDSARKLATKLQELCYHHETN